MLCEEIKPIKENEMPANTAIQWLQPIRSEIEYFTEQFLKRGGKIVEVEPGVSGEIVDNMSKYINEFTGGYDKHRADTIKSRNGEAKKKREMELHQFDGKPRKAQKSKWGQNIVKAKGKSQTNFYVLIDGSYHGVKDNLTHAEAIALRDKMRAKRGMPPAEY